MIGNVLGNRYRVLREIGAGGMAKVYLAEDISENKLVAVKVLYPQFSEDISFIQRFTREAKLASTLTDPHIVRVLDWGADRDLHYLVMEYIEGKDLNHHLKQDGRLEWKFTLEIIDQLATALEQAHSHGVVHRDIKPQNLMLQDNGLLKVLDFGIARISTLPSLTQSGFIGSPYYASPEQAMGEEVDIRSDIYSAGIALYELLSGNIPFDATSPWSIISQHITSEPPPIELTDDELPDGVKGLLEKMLAKRPENRFQTPTALRQAIAEVLAGNPLPGDTMDTTPIAFSNKASLIESLYQRASQAMEAEEWARAVDLLSQVTKLSPSNTEVAQKLTYAEGKSRLTSLYKVACRAMENSMWEEAIGHFNVIVELDTDYKDTNKLLDKAHQALKSENMQRFIAARYSEGLAHFEAERWLGAVEAFSEVHKLNPTYNQVQQYLGEAKRHANPTLIQKLQRLSKSGSQDIWRWGLVAVGLIAIIFLFLAFDNNRASGDDDVRERLKILYAEAQTALEQNDQSLALAKLEEILAEDPDYADAADIRRELVATPTPTTVPAVIIATVVTVEDPLAQLLREAQDNIELALWNEAIDNLNYIRSTNPDYEAARVASLFCDAYVGRGLENIANIDADVDETEVMQLASFDFQAGAEECPRRTDLQEQAERASAYLEALSTPASDFETLIPLLTPIVAANENYANKKAKNILYNAYIARAISRQAVDESIAAALGDYEAALALNVDDPSEAQTRRAELLLLFSQRPSGAAIPTEVAAVSDGSVTPEATPNTVATPDNAPTATPRPPVRIKYPKPELVSPPDDTLFSGQFSEVILEWEPVGELAEDEYYDLTIMHLFADQPQYSGSMRLSETRVQIEGASIGVGEAGNDRFYWWVTVRKDGTAPSPDTLDLPLSPRSNAGTFVWSR